MVKESVESHYSIPDILDIRTLLSLSEDDDAAPSGDMKLKHLDIPFD